MRKLLVVVDMQNDFITGPLGTPEAISIVPKVKEFIDSFDGPIVYTMDSHDKNYLETQEGRRLPVEHCIINTPGWELVDGLIEAGNGVVFYKNTFGSLAFAEWLDDQPYFEEIHLIGVCTGICVIANANLAKAVQPEARIVIHKNLCACVTPESHETALKAMQLLQMDIEE